MANRNMPTFKVVENAPTKNLPIPPLFQKPQSNSINPDEDDIKMVMDFYEIGTKDKRDMVSKWDEYYKFFKGDQWPKKRPKYKSNAHDNVIRNTIMSIIPILTDTEPGFDVLPEEPNDHEFASILSKIVLSWWQKNSMPMTLVEVLMDSMIYSAGILKIGWDQELKDGLGDIRTDIIDPRNIFLSPDARDFTEDKGCKWVIQEMFKPVGEIRRVYPHLASQIKPDDTKKDDEKNSNKGAVSYQSPVDQEQTTRNQGINNSSDDRQMVRVLECWMFDETIEAYEKTTEDGQIVKIDKKKYPAGKVITILPNQKLKLSEIPNPYKHRKFPYIRFVDTLLPRSFWGEGEAEPLMSLQMQINKSLANIQDYMNTFSNPYWIKEEGCGVDGRNITNQYGMVLTTKNGQIDKIKRVSPPPIPQYIFQFYSTLIQASERTSGIGELSQGRKPTSVISGAGIEALQEAAQTRIRLKERNMTVSLEQFGRLWVSLAMQFYRAPRIARLTGKEGRWPEFLEFSIKENLEDGKFTLNSQKTVFNEEADKFVSDDTKESNPSKGIFDIKIASGTSLPLQKSQLGNLAITLYDKGIIGADDLLNKLDWPNVEEVLRKKREKEEAAAQEAANQNQVEGQ